MNKNIKMLALDIDGTLMGTNFIINKPVVDAIKRVIDNTDIIVLLASGRMTYSTLPIATQLGISNPIVVYQGAMVNDFKNDKIIFHQTINSEYGLEIIEDIEKEDLHVNVYINDQLYLKKLSEIAKVYSSYRYVEPIIVNNFSIINESQPTKILALDYDYEKIQNVKNKLQEKYCGKVNIFGSCPMFIEIVNLDVNKGKTVIETAKKLWDIDPENIMAIGDADNDYNMLKLSGYSVAMGNCTEKARSAAKYITSSVDEDGAAKAINNIIFEQEI